MKQILIILEDDVINNSFYLGKSGDFATIDYFLRKNYQVFVCNSNDLQKSAHNLPVFQVKNNNYIKNYCQAILNECNNITNKKTPSFGITQEMCVKLEYKETNLTDIKHNSLLVSRAMPQSLNQKFLTNFKILAQEFQTIQNMEEIVLYKDKVIPFLLQNNPDYIKDFAQLYSQNILNFEKNISDKNLYKNLSINSIIVDLSENFEKNFEKISHFAKQAICIKPFNLFGGIGVGIFNNINKEEIRTQFAIIKKHFESFNINSNQLVLVQNAVRHPEFGDIRAIFSKGKFLGAFKRYEPKNLIHNTINGAIIIPVSNKNLNFFSSFEEKYHSAFKQAINGIESLSFEENFLKNEVFYGCDLLLDETKYGFEFKLTEINIACPTGFAFLDSSLLCNSNTDLTMDNIEKYFATNRRTIDICIEN